MKNNIRKIVISALLLALGIVLPFFTAQLKEIGDTLLPMHIPVMLCGLICGWKYGFLVGVMIPFLRSVLFGMPPIYPNAVWMALEMGTYGLVIGILYNKDIVKGKIKIYVSLISAMLAGRIVWGIAKLILLGAKGLDFTFTAFIAGGFVDALPGIILQLVLIPAIILIIEKFKIESKE